MRKHLPLHILAVLCAVIGALTLTLGAALLASTLVTRSISLQDLTLQNISLDDRTSLTFTAVTIIRTAVTLGELIMGILGIFSGIGLLAISGFIEVFITIQRDMRTLLYRVEQWGANRASLGRSQSLED